VQPSIVAHRSDPSPWTLISHAAISEEDDVHEKFGGDFDPIWLRRPLAWQIVRGFTSFCLRLIRSWWCVYCHWKGQGSGNFFNVRYGVRI
jgi:hypothetical protein